MTPPNPDTDPKLPPRRDGLPDERDDPQTQPADGLEVAEENAATSLDQPSDGAG
ncbi:MAG: hypothetical protein NTV23_12075 [Propionibacteriales bacterium]|nr:hypothetical protein [Propionibacteriales bacterium]